jgi:hypothetical protein
MSTWNVSGTYLETCNCEAACPCVFLGPPTSGDCTALIAWHIDQGAFAGVRLDGLNVALAVHSPGPMVKTKWRVVLYLDARATPPQGEALGKIFSGQAGGHPANLAPFIGQVLGAKNAEIEFRVEGNRRSLRIAGIADTEIEALAGPTGGDVTIHNPPLCVAPGYPTVVARSNRVQFRDFDLKLEVSGKNGFYSPFAYQSA